MRYRPIGVIAAMLVAVSVGEAQSTSLEELLARMGAYLLDYEAKAFELVAEEQYEQ